MSTAIVRSDEFLLHDTGAHPENCRRYTAALSGLISDNDLWERLVKLNPRLATNQDLLRCHSQSVIARIDQACSIARPHIALDQDTVVSNQSAQIARLAAGGACAAVDEVVRGQSRSVFVACRPPGHHATAGTSMGFCLYNNVAVAARYARSTYPQEIRHVLIVDFDVHHGNGTQEIFYDDPTVFYYSLHQYPWYPGTGSAVEIGENDGEGYTLNIPVRAMTPAGDYLQMFDRGLDLVMKKFSPDLIIISAGFDAHQSDPLGQLLLDDQSYREITRMLKDAAQTSAGGRVVSCLEGGYNLQTIPQTVRTHVDSLD
ncbi:MAG: histone deacetylase [Acidobacteria bacterium]|nr:histone deacetylase [Acidobacteriota bacterium]